MPRGHETTYTQEMASTLCDRIAAGELLAHICREPGMPKPSTVYKWLSQQPDFVEAYGHARETAAELRAGEIIEIADTPMIGEKIVHKSDGTTDVHEGDMIEHRRLMIDARKWTAAKLKPRVYGDKQQVELSGSLQIETATDDELIAEFMELFASGRMRLPPGMQLIEPPEDEETSEFW